MEKCIYLGYEDGYKGYKCLNPETGRIVISRDIIFNEDVFPGIPYVEGDEEYVPISGTDIQGRMYGGGGGGGGVPPPAPPAALAGPAGPQQPPQPPHGKGGPQQPPPRPPPPSPPARDDSEDTIAGSQPPEAGNFNFPPWACPLPGGTYAAALCRAQDRDSADYQPPHTDDESNESHSGNSTGKKNPQTSPTPSHRSSTPATPKKHSLIDHTI